MLIIYDGKKTYGISKELLHTNIPPAVIGSMVFDTKTNEVYWIDDFEAPWNIINKENINPDSPSDESSALGDAIIGEMILGE